MVEGGCGWLRVAGLGIDDGPVCLGPGWLVGLVGGAVACKTIASEF